MESEVVRSGSQGAPGGSGLHWRVCEPLSKWEDSPHHPLLNRGLLPAPPAPPRVHTTPTRERIVKSNLSDCSRARTRTHTDTERKPNSFQHSFPVMVTTRLYARGDRSADLFAERGTIGDPGGGGRQKLPRLFFYFFFFINLMNQRGNYCDEE